MPDETKSPPPPSPENENPTADKPATPGGVKSTPSGSVQSETKTTPAETATPPKAAAPATPAKPASPATPAAKPAAPAAGHPAPPKPAGPVPTPWDSPLVAKYKREYGTGINPLTHLGQNYFEVDRSLIPEILQLLRDDEKFDYCVDVTAVHYPKREKQFDVVWVLYSFQRNERIRVKTQIADGETVPSSVPLWATCNWLEREVYDMFGIKFDGHPDLKRILLPDGWKGFPLRKDYGILQQDNEWVQINLGIESGQ
ncbi:MAG TPA: NADH-quinone oxidoreductase subunit C [Candidatus Sulfotelmatobacter sp.]|jgi:NADH-quinone oxidoreductase subunit C|nr:NADH-quinone oxidoreductase subunit C [Candidatus Sulfotelmatobacter sp.]